MEFDRGEKHAACRPSGRLSGESRVAAPQLVTGNTGDHKLIYEMLRVANRAPDHDEFLASLDEPTYEPNDRLLVKLAGQIVAHAQILDRVAWFGGVKLPVAGIEALATLPEYHDSGFERLLIAAAESAMRDSQSVVAFARSDFPDVFAAWGWMHVGQPPCTEANVNEVLARLSAATATGPGAKRMRPLRIRLWRQVELDALLNVYRQTAATTWGALDRGEAYWRWLVGRKTHDELIVAIHGRDCWDTLDSPSRIVGYAVTRGSQIVELATLPAFRRAAGPLIARVCHDAIERDQRTISLHVPANDPLHELILSAGGRWLPKGRSSGGAWWIKLLDPVRWIESTSEVLLERARKAQLTRPLFLTFDLGLHCYRFELTRRSAHLVRDDAANVDVRCSAGTFGALLLGNLDVVLAGQAGLLEFRAPEAQARLAALFPRVAFWQSPLDSLRI